MISLVVCTYERAALLERMLASAARLEIPPGLPWEIVLVDNGSGDATQRVAEGFRERLPLVVLREPRPGKTLALNRAVAAAAGELLLFADDDVTLRRPWLRSFVEAAAADPEAGWFGGRSVPAWEGAAPGWIGPDVLGAFGGYLCNYDLGGVGRPYREGDLLPIGACMAVRRGVFERVGLFDTGLGPRGKDRGVGDDTELIMRARSAGIAGRYVPEAVVDHFVPAGRLRAASVLRYGVIKGRQQAAIAGRRGGPPQGRVAGQAARGLVQLARGRRDRALVCVLNIGLAIGSRRWAPPGAGS